MRGDGDGWVTCRYGHRHWGVHGAAGLLLRRVGERGVVEVLMQHRAPWTSDGDTWGLPGGARDSHESAEEAALREAEEEAGIRPESVRVTGQHLDDHGGWSYTTVIAEAADPLLLVANAESLTLEWTPIADVALLNLHPGFAGSWPAIKLR